MPSRGVAVAARLAAAALLLGIGVALPMGVVATIGSPLPTRVQWDALRATGHLDDAMAIRIGLTLAAVLWAWFVVTAAREVVVVASERREVGASVRAVPTPVVGRSAGSTPTPSPGLVPAPRGPVERGWVRRLVRLAMVGGAVTVVTLAASSLGERADENRGDAPIAASTTDPASAAGVVVPGPSVAADAAVSSAPADAPWAELVVGGLAATGVVAAIGRERRRRLRATIPGSIVATPSSAVIEREESLRALAAGEDLARLGYGLGAARRALVSGGAAPLLVELSDSGEIRMLPDRPLLPDTDVWHTDPRDGWWVVSASTDLTELAAAAGGEAAALGPLLVDLGRRVVSIPIGTSPGHTPIEGGAGARVMVDLGRARRLEVSGAGATEVARALCLGLAGSDRIGAARIVVFGLDATAWSPLVRQCASPTEWLDELAMADGAAVGDSRETWVGCAPSSVIAGGPTDLLGRASAIVSWSEEGAASSTLAPGSIVLELDGEVATVRPFGRRVVPVRAALDDAVAIAELVTGEPAAVSVVDVDVVAQDLSVADPSEVDAAEAVAIDASPAEASPDVASPNDASPTDVSPTDVAPTAASPTAASPDDVSPDDVSPTDVSPDDTRQTETPERPVARPVTSTIRAAAPSGPTFVVRLLGPVRVETLGGEVVTFERSKALELVAWLATHRTRPTRGRARAALWEVDVRTATFHNVISDARRSLARLVTPPEGVEWVGRSDGELLPLHAAVACDLDMVDDALRQCGDLDDSAAIEVLRPVVELLDGPPFSGTDYLWSDSEGIASAAVLSATTAATELARRCLSLGDTAGVFAATGRGLSVLPGHEELVSLRMLAHDAAGDRAGIRDEWERYSKVLAADAWPGDGDGATPPPKMLALRRTLLP